MERGYVYGFRIGGDKVRFKVKVVEEIPVPERYYNFNVGWYLETTGEVVETISEVIVLYPPFFYIIERTSDWKEFEKYVPLLLKLLGIHEIYRYENQRGQPDGFFKFRNMAVVYDCTLETFFDELKENQINNYCTQLKTTMVRFGKKSMDISQCNKQVWIITRGTPRVIKQVDDIIVKEMPLSKLFKIYR